MFKILLGGPPKPGLMGADEEGDPTVLHENTPTNPNVNQRVKIDIELWMAVAAIGFVAGFGFVAGVGAVFIFKILPK
jgi:hypothetical protein